MSEPTSPPAPDSPLVPSPDRDPFNPAGITWTRVSPKLATLQLLVGGISLGVLLLIAVIVAWVVGAGWGWAAPVALAVVAALYLGLVPRRVRAWGYTEQDDDLVLTHGIMFKTLVVVPYGRMQYVDVQAGPIERAFGLATVQLHTASPGTDAAIPGLVASEAARLRERLASRGESRLAGL